MQTVFVTGATGLLGNNLVRALIAKGMTVRALVRSRHKAREQFHGLSNIEIIEGDMQNVADFADSLVGCDALFHTAAYFRDSYYGGRHWTLLERINVKGTNDLLNAAYAAGIRRFVHTSSIAVVNGPRGALIDESMKRDVSEADDYYRSKILCDRVVSDFLLRHPDMFGVFVMPGWMHGPGDIGPTSAGQFTLDFMQRKLPGIPPATVSFVDARDVAAAMISAVDNGRRGEHYLAAGRHTSMRDLMRMYQEVTGIPAPIRAIPPLLLWIVAGCQEIIARISGRPALLSVATVRIMRREIDRSHFDHSKSEAELRLGFRPITETIRDEVDWYMTHGKLPTTSMSDLTSLNQPQD